MDLIVAGFYSAMKIGGIIIGIYFAVRLIKAIVE
jgi:hypothetical protein